MISPYKKLSYIARTLAQAKVLPEDVMLAMLVYIGYDPDEYREIDDIGPAFLSLLPTPSAAVIDAIFSVSFWANEIDSLQKEEFIRKVLLELSEVCDAYPNTGN